LGGTLCKIGSPLLSFLLCSLCTPLQTKFNDQGQLEKWPIGFFDPDGV